MPLVKNQIIPLAIDGISSDGNGLGRHEGQVVFVPGSAPGDVLQVKVVKATARHAFGRIEAVQTPGPGRVVSACPVSGRCGGCAFQHITYEAELAAKQGFVQDALRRIGGIDLAVDPILPSPHTLRYRNKVQYPVAPAPDGGLAFGFYAARSHQVVPWGDCLLQPELLNHITRYVLAFLEAAGADAYSEARHTGLLRHICLRRGEGSGQVMLCIVAIQNALPRERDLCESVTAAFPEVASIQLNVNPAVTNVIFGKETRVLWGNATIESTLAGVPQRLGPLAFSQVNPRGAEELFAVAREFAGLTGKEHLLDLYCGAGVIGLSMARQCQSLTGVEIHPESIENARLSAKEMGLGNTRFLCGDAGEAARQLAREGAPVDVAVLDPPRKGCSPATLSALGHMAPGRIVMVSCNPATMARDVRLLCEDQGYRVRQVCPVDMFPRTRHVECVVLLEAEKT